MDRIDMAARILGMERRRRSKVSIVMLAVAVAALVCAVGALMGMAV